MSKMDRIAEKHPALSLSDLKFAGEYLEEICACDYPKETALLAENLLWRHLRASVCKYRKPGASCEIFDFFIFCLNKPFSELFSKIQLKVPKAL